MSTVNIGNQTIVWKYTTPLRAEYLNRLVAGLTGPGLASRPKCTVSTSAGVGNLTINPFSLFIEPNDKKSSFETEDGKHPVNSLVKVFVEEPVSLVVNTNIVAVGFTYSFTNNGQNQPVWYGDFVLLAANDVEAFEGIIIATVQHYTDSSTGMTYYSVRTSGADISDILLNEEGWNPNCWLSLVSPRRMVVEAGGTGNYNQFEVRSHNSMFSHYVSGHAGLSLLSNLRWTIPVDPIYDPTGDRGTMMPNRFCAFNINSEGFNLCNYSAALPILECKGGIIGLADAACSLGGVVGTSFANQIILKPNDQEKINCYYNEDTLFIA